MKRGLLFLALVLCAIALLCLCIPGVTASARVLLILAFGSATSYLASLCWP